MGLQDIIIVPSDKNCDTLKHVESNLITQLKNEQDGLSVRNLISLAEHGFFKKNGYIHEFLENSEIYLVETPREPRNPDLEARVQKLKADQENAEYRKMTKGLACPYDNKTRDNLLRDDVKQITSQITAVINFVLTVAGSFFFTYKAVEYSLPESNIPAQVLMGIITATVVALADLYFLIRTI